MILYPHFTVYLCYRNQLFCIEKKELPELLGERSDIFVFTGHVEIPEALLYYVHVRITLGFANSFRFEHLVIFLDPYFRWVIHRFTICTVKQ